MTLQEKIRARGLNEKAEIANLMRRLTYRMRHGDRLKTFADANAYGDRDIKHAISTLREASAANDTPTYVQAWCKLNNLKG